MNRVGADSIEAIYREESRRVLATLIRLLGDFELAEEALHEAFAAALMQWPQEGAPENPRAWLVSTGRFKAIDAIRRRRRFDASIKALARESNDEAVEEFDELDESHVADDQLRLIFTCCHPALAPDARVALTLREICGLTTEAIARAYLTPTPTLAQRIVRAKAKIRDAGIPYEVPDPGQRAERLDTVLHVIYLLFNEGYAASSGESLTRAALSNEAIRLGRLLHALMPEPEVSGLLALLLLHESRREARTTSEGELVPLEEQNRRRWDRALIEEGCKLVETALRSRRFGPYTLQAAISAVHAEASSAEATDWNEITGLYAVLLHAAPSPVIALNRAVAVAMRDGPEHGLALIEQLRNEHPMEDYQPLHAARAELYRRARRFAEARAAYQRALALSQLQPEKRYLARQLATCKD